MEVLVNENEKRLMRSTPHIVTFLILTLMVTFIIVTKSIVVYDSKTKDIPIFTSASYDFGDKELNPSEYRVLTMLDTINKGKGPFFYESRTNMLYIETLYKHLSSTRVDLSNSDAAEVEKNIQNLQEIRISERSRDISHMSVDGRRIATYLSRKIYEICGLNLEYNLGGYIVEITDQSGNLLYTDTQPGGQDNMHFDALGITLFVIATLLCFCIVIAKRNQLFVKEVEYDEFDEERFA